MNPAVRWRALLVEKFPLAFAPKGQPKKPLKIGISDDAVARAGFKKFLIYTAIKDYCEGPSYYAACTPGAVRIDLDGNQAGVVTEEQAVYAAEMLATYPETVREKWSAKQCA